MADARETEPTLSLDDLIWPHDETATMHDAELLAVKIDYTRAHAELLLKVWIGDSSSDGPAMREGQREGTLVIEGLQMFSIEPARARGGHPDREGLWIDAELGEPEPDADLDQEPAVLQASSQGLRFWIFVQDWNSFMRVECDTVRFQWSDTTGNGG